uniref:Vps16 C-terminal domain-containing protein n=1 Tax=Plectus sambesii TaxID=2011161 RepID=A0A914VU44_9BILA
MARKFQFDNPDDSYWNESSAGGSFFDDGGSASTAQATARAALNDLFDSSAAFRNNSKEGSRAEDVETVDWSGALVSGSIPSPLQSSRFDPHTKQSGSLSATDLLSTASSFSQRRNESKGNVSPQLARSQRAASVISEGSVESSGTGFSQLDHTRLKSEHKKLQIRYEQVRQERYHPPEIDETIRRLLRGESAILELYKTKHKKVQLLEAALDLRDGNVILAVVLFLKQTLADSLFRDLLLRMPRAANHYVAYLRDHFKFDDLSNILFSLGRNDDAAAVEFLVACRKQTSHAKVQSLKRAVQSGFSDPTLNQEAAIVADYVALLERQIPVDSSDDTASKQGREQKFKVYPKTATLVDQPTLTTLYYCALYHFDLPQNSFASPLAVKEQHKLTEKQYSWLVVKALARQKRWADIERVLTTKSLLGSAKINPVIPWTHLLTILARHDASHDTMAKYLRAIPSWEERLVFALDYKCSDVIVDCYVALKDRQKLIEYMSTKLTAHTKEHYYAEGVLRNSMNKWKN